MTWRIEYREADRVVHLKTFSTHTPSDIDQLTKEAVAEGRKHGVNRYLVDDREMDPDFRTLEIYNLPKRLLGLGMTKESRIAVVISVTAPKMADWKFFQDRITTFGALDIRIFVDSIDDALEWLRSQP